MARALFGLSSMTCRVLKFTASARKPPTLYSFWKPAGYTQAVCTALPKAAADDSPPLRSWSGKPAWPSSAASEPITHRAPHGAVALGSGKSADFSVRSSAHTGIEKTIEVVVRYRIIRVVVGVLIPTSHEVDLKEPAERGNVLPRPHLDRAEIPGMLEKLLVTPHPVIRPGGRCIVR